MATSCCRCLLAKFHRHQDKLHDKISVSEEEKIHIKRRPARTYQHHRSGALGRLEQILQRQCPDENERYRLLEHAEDVLPKDTAPRFTKNWNESLLHELVTAVPFGKEEEMASRGLIHAVLQDGVELSCVDAAGDPPLLKAVKARNRVAVDMLLRSKSKCEVNAKDRSGRTCLLYAAYVNDEETVKQLLTLGGASVKLDVTDFARYTALCYAASHNNITVCKLLLDAGANPNASSVSPLYLAVKNNCSFELVGLLVNRGSSVNTSVDFTGLSVLTAAAKEGRADVVTLLLKSDANCNTVWHRNLAFISALQKDHVDVLKVFIDHGVSIQPDSASGAVRFNADPRVKATGGVKLKEGFKNTGSNILHEAASQGSAGFLSYLVVETDIDLDQQDRYRKTPFYLAAQNGHEFCMEVLFKAGVDCCKPDAKGQTPLEAALFYHHATAAVFFVKYCVCPRQVLFSTLHMLENVYDHVALAKNSAVNKFRSCILERWGDSDQMETLAITCIIKIRQCLGQRGMAKVRQLPVPSRVQDAILMMKRL